MIRETLFWSVLEEQRGSHITALAREMGIKKILINKLASGLCAYGQNYLRREIQLYGDMPGKARQRGGLRPHQRTLSEHRKRGR